MNEARSINVMRSSRTAFLGGGNPMQQQNIRFEIRKGVKIAHKHNTMIQAGYDTVDRHANLLGHINFVTLFSAPLGEVVGQVIPHIERVAGYGLIDDPAKVATLFKRLDRYNGDESFVNIVDRMYDEGDFPKQAVAAVYQLWNFHGIRLPELSNKPRAMAGVRQGMLELLEHVPDFSHRTIWEAPMVKDLRTARIAVQHAADVDIIYVPHNGLCCNLTRCMLGLASDFCSIGSNGCAAGSTPCASAQYASGADDGGCC